MIRPGKITAAVAGAMLVIFALASGGAYPWARGLFFLGASLLLVVNLAAGGLPPASYAAFLPALAAALSALWSINLNNAAGQALQLFSYAAFAASASSLSGKDERGLALGCLLAAAGIVSAYTVYQYFIGFAHTEEVLREAAARGEAVDGYAARILGYRRAFSTFFSPNALACYLASVFPVGLAFASGGGKTRPVYVLLLALMLLALLLTKSVGGTAALCAGVVAYILLTRGMRTGTRRRALYLLVAAAVVSAALYGALRYRAGGELGVGRSAGQRLEYWAGALSMAKESPVLGNGAGSFEILFPRYVRPGGDETRYAHDLFLQTAAETGMPGLLSLGALIALFFAAGIKKARAPGGGPSHAGLVSGGFAFLVANLTDFSYYIQESALPFWLFAGLMLAPAGEDRRGRRALAALSLLAMLVPLYIYGVMYMAEHKKDEALAVLREAGITTSALARANPAPLEAVRLAEDAVRLKGYDDRLHAFLAGLYEGRGVTDGPGMLKMAESEYRRAIALNPKYSFYYRDLGILYLKAGDRTRALDCFKNALSLYPANENFKKYLSIAENK